MVRARIITTMHTTEVPIGYDVLAVNAELAGRNRNALDKFGITAFNIMGAIGSGKTLLIEKTIERMGKSCRIGAIAGDVVARIDAAACGRGWVCGYTGKD